MQNVCAKRTSETCKRTYPILPSAFWQNTDKTDSFSGVDPGGGNRSPKIWSGRETNIGVPPQTFCFLCTLVHMILWCNAMITFASWSDSARNTEPSPRLSNWDGVRSRSLRVRTSIFFGARLRAPCKLLLMACYAGDHEIRNEETTGLGFANSELHRLRQSHRAGVAVDVDRCINSLIIIRLKLAAAGAASDSPRQPGSVLSTRTAKSAAGYSYSLSLSLSLSIQRLSLLYSFCSEAGRYF